MQRHEIISYRGCHGGLLCKCAMVLGDCMRNLSWTRNVHSTVSSLSQSRFSDYTVGVLPFVVGSLHEARLMVQVVDLC